MAKAKTTATIDTTAGTKAYALALQYHAELEPRLPLGIVANLAADLTTLGAAPTPPPAPTPPAQPPPSLAEAMITAVTLISAVHEAIRGAQVKPSVRKAYGVSNKAPGEEAKAVIASGEKIVSQAHANPTEALSLGILPSDVTALVQALADLTAAETLAKGKAGQGSTTGKERHAAEGRMHEAVARIGGAGVLAFATNAAVRAEFAALKGMKSG
jgi:hypothetical protein